MVLHCSTEPLPPSTDKDNKATTMCEYEKTEYYCKDCDAMFAVKLGDRNPCDNHSEDNPCLEYNQKGDTKEDKTELCATCKAKETQTFKTVKRMRFSEA